MGGNSKGFSLTFFRHCSPRVMRHDMHLHREHASHRSKPAAVTLADGETGPRFEGGQEGETERDVNRRCYRTGSQFIRPTTRYDESTGRAPSWNFFSFFSTDATLRNNLHSWKCSFAPPRQLLVRDDGNVGTSQSGSHTDCKDVTLFCTFQLHNTAMESIKRRSSALARDICIALAYFLSDLHPSVCALYYTTADAHMLVWFLSSATARPTLPLLLRADRGPSGLQDLSSSVHGRERRADGKSAWTTIGPFRGGRNLRATLQQRIRRRDETDARLLGVNKYQLVIQCDNRSPQMIFT